ncbi:hypothetical protein RRG08_008975 [Elysia crispata]|uniref:DUF6729 domain-containing protein n=1 Tax=Elysia crispata TaxID=231223 RepID=A0AAE1AHW3_9GAST|nr:hypothetical protein RRG08_008975 [Elysia crispata]
MFIKITSFQRFPSYQQTVFALRTYPQDFSTKGAAEERVAENTASTANALFTESGRLKNQLQMWWHPPQPALVYSQPPATPNVFFHRQFFLWMPYRMLAFPFLCCQPGCDWRQLSCGHYKTAPRRVIDQVDDYYMGTEYLECAVLSYHLALDRRVVSELRDRSLGNSDTTLYRKLSELHYHDYMERVPKRVPSARWLLSVYVADCYTRLADITSTFGTVLKMNSIKRVVRKLSGPARGGGNTAAWVTNVGNEYGQQAVKEEVFVFDSTRSVLLGRGTLGVPLFDGARLKHTLAQQRAPSSVEHCSPGPPRAIQSSPQPQSHHLLPPPFPTPTLTVVKRIMSKQSSASVEPQLRGWNQFLKLSATPEASRVEKANESQVFRAREPSVVRKEAISQLPTGLRTNHTAILGATTLEFGLYYGQTFRWALENATGWVVGVVAKVMEEPKVDSFIEANKKLLERYALTFPLVKGEVEYKLASLKSTKDVYETGDVGLTLVRFGEFRDLSWRSCPCLAEKSTGGCVSPAARRTSPRKASASASSTASATPAYRRVPSASWLLFVYVADCSTRLAELKANITSTFGTVLKMDSTKRVVRKLSGSAGGTAAWATNVDNEHGQQAVKDEVSVFDSTRSVIPRTALCFNLLNNCSAGSHVCAHCLGG